MSKKNIFFKNKNNSYIIFVTFIIFIIFFSFTFFKNTNTDLFIISSFNDNYFIIPENKGGKKILNINKKSLHMNEILDSNNINEDISNMKFSIQFFSSPDYKTIESFLVNLINQDENIYSSDDFYIVTLTTEISKDYLLLFKNFNTREKALDFCNDFLTKLDNCLIVNLNNL